MSECTHAIVVTGYLCAVAITIIANATIADGIETELYPAIKIRLSRYV